MLKKIFGMLIVVCLVASVTLIPIVANAARNGQGLVDVAMNEVGNSDGTKYGTSGAWCAAFVSWCARQAGISTDVIKNTITSSATEFGVPYYTWNDYYRGAYVPSIGDLVFFNWSSNEQKSWADHVGIIRESPIYNGNYVTITTVEGNMSGRVRSDTIRRVERDTGKITSFDSGYIIGFGKPNYGSSITSPPSNATLSINKENFLLGETFTLTCESDSPCDYYMSIIDVDSGQVVDSGGISGTYSNSFQRAGHYTAYITAYNSQGSVNSNWVDFYFFGEPPTIATISASKSKLCLGEFIKFDTYTNAYYARIYMTITFEKGNVVFSGNIPYEFEYKPLKKGVYYTHITAYTHEGGVDSNHISFEVYDSAAINPKISANKTVVNTGESITFTSEADYATNYVLGIDKKGVGRISTPNIGTNNSYTTSFSELGIYSVYATCYNELGGCDSSKIEFIVIDDKSVFCIQNSTSLRVVKKLNINKNNYSCIIALYEDGKMVNFKNKSNLNGIIILDETILCSEKYDTIKIMVWDSLSTLKPLCEAEVIPSSEWIVE
ncbi:MAG: CHAP domain-containing protein [Ruminococcaceae bacterium]|nr:CHAP domain-containing protein [Oscillospiraceae bacterium]